MAMLVTPSILTANMADLVGEIGRIPNADELHLDVMDGHFVPNLTFGLPVVQSLRAVTTKPLDAHLMIEDPDRWAPGYAEAGCELVTFHIEAAHAPVRLARELRRLGARVGVSLKPATPVEMVLPLLDEVDRILFMTVEPGFGGQKFLDLVLPKIRRCVRELDGRNVEIQVDGGVSLATIGACAQAGATVFVAGSAVFDAPIPDEMINELRGAATAAVCREC